MTQSQLVGTMFSIVAYNYPKKCKLYLITDRGLQVLDAKWEKRNNPIRIVFKASYYGFQHLGPGMEEWIYGAMLCMEDISKKPSHVLCMHAPWDTPILLTNESYIDIEFYLEVDP